MGIVKTALAPPQPVPVLSGEADARTRDRVTRVLLEGGPTTAGALAERLGVTTTAIRRHLDTLLADGVVVARDAPAAGVRGRGRPAKLFALTEAGHEQFGHAYDDIATAALRFLAASVGESAVTAFAQARAAEIERRYRALVQAAPATDQATALATAMRGDGYAATVTPLGAGEQLCQHHCPVQHVAAEFPQLCVAETEAIGRLLGTHVQRLATIAHGDGICTTHIPGSSTTPVAPGSIRTTPVAPGTTTQEAGA